MTTYNEALVEKAAWVLHQRAHDRLKQHARPCRWCDEDARAVLDAVAGTLRAEALREAADEIEEVRESGVLPDGVNSHPIVGDDWLRDRADQIEAGT